MGELDAMQYASLNDAAEHLGLSALATGPTRIYFRKKPYPSSLETGEKEFVLVGSVASTNLQEIRAALQESVWCPGGEADELLESLGISHKSFGLGDMIETDEAFHVLDAMNFVEMPKEENENVESGFVR